MHLPSLPTQVATDALVAMEKAMARDGIITNDRQLACARINSQVGGGEQECRHGAGVNCSCVAAAG